MGNLPEYVRGSKRTLRPGGVDRDRLIREAASLERVLSTKGTRRVPDPQLAAGQNGGNERPKPKR